MVRSRTSVEGQSRGPTWAGPRSGLLSPLRDGGPSGGSSDDEGVVPR
ncbi:hypothetical protein UO65_5527 [Actinokineospora spheciospongiae]|uniref:Uncharacterized protein n=1 Tax=Actinokineospora spheciospongiae TaxID=909613 RepID=W7IEA4_9PSEU|nr:hypothetical protein UO65_5527 [Actinokineospora spheciospongiae]